MALSRNIQQKIIKLRKTVPSLKKEDSAPDAGFNYVSIDRYYETIARMAAEEGLGWTLCTVHNQQFFDHTGTLVTSQSFAYDLWDAESGDFAEGAISFDVDHPFQDAQTAGSSISYADKCMMRHLFCVVTGEKDADHYARGRQKPTPKVTSNEDVGDPFVAQAREESVTHSESAALVQRAQQIAEKKSPPTAPPAEESKKPRGRPPKPAEAPVKEPALTVEGNTTTGSHFEETEIDGLPWHDGDNLSWKEKSAILLPWIKACKTEAELTKFRKDYADQINELKAAGLAEEPGAVDAMFELNNAFKERLQAVAEDDEDEDDE